MKKRKILYLFPLAALLLSGCTFQEGFQTAKSWVGDHIYHPIKDWINGGSSKEEEQGGGGGDTPTPTPGPGEKTLQEIVSVSAPKTIKKGETLAPSSVDLVVKYSDNSTADVKAESVELDTSKVGDAVQGTAHYKTLSKTFTIKVYEEGGEEETDYGTLEKPISVSAAYDIIVKECVTDQGSATKEVIYCQGEIKSVGDYVTTGYYKQVTVTDGTKDIYIATLNVSADLKDSVVVGAKIVFHGYGRASSEGEPQFGTSNNVYVTIDSVEGKEIKEYGAITGPEEVEVGSQVQASQVSIAVTYSDNTNGSVHPTKVDEIDSSAQAEGVAVTVHHGEWSGTFTVNVVAAVEYNYGTKDNPIGVADALDLITKQCITGTESYTKQEIYCQGEISSIGEIKSASSGGYYAKSVVVKQIGGDATISINSINMTAEQKDSFLVGATMVFHGYGRKNNQSSQPEFGTGPESAFVYVETLTGGGEVPPVDKEIKTYDGVTGPTSIYVDDDLALDAVNIAVTYDDSTTGTIHPTSIDDFDNEHTAASVTVTVHYNTAYTGTFTLAVLEKPASTDVTAKSTIAKIAEDNSWVNDTQYKSFDLDSNISVSAATTGSNTGKYYTNGNQWRLYQTESPTVTISAKEGKIKTVKVTYVSDKTGAMLVGTNTVASGDVCAVNAVSFSFGVGNTGAVTNGQVRVTELEVVYEVAQPTVSSVVVTPAELALDVGMPGTQLSAVVNGDNNPSQAVTWSSSNSNVASVSATGVVTAEAEGSANIIATSVQDGKTTGVCAVTVSQPAVPITLDSLTVSGTFKIKYAAGELLDLTGMVVTANYSNDTHVPVTSEEYDVSIAANHQLETSDVSFTVSYNQVSSDPVTISVGTLSSVAVKTQPTKLSYLTGETIDLTGMVVTLTYSNEYTKDIEEGFTTNLDDKELGLSDTSLVVSFGGFSADAITLTITAKPQPVHAGTLEDPYTVSDAKIVFDDLAEGAITNEVYVTGTIAESPAPALSGGRGRFYLTDGSETDLYVYNINNIGGSNNVALADIPAGSVVVAKGGIKNYQGTFELCFNNENPVVACELISVDKPVIVPATVTISGAVSVQEEKTITLTAEVGPVGAPQDVVWSVESGSEHASVDQNGVVTGIAEGAATIRATAVDHSDIYGEYNVSVTAKPDTPSEEAYRLVTNASDLADGSTIIISNNNSTYAMGAYADGNNVPAVAVTASDGVLEPGTASVLTLEDAGNGHFYIKLGNGYLYAAASNKNQLKVKSAKDSANGVWEFSYSGGHMNIVAYGSSNRNVMQYNANNGSPIFACYASATQTALQVYRYC